MARKIQISISLQQETLINLRKIMKEQNLSRSVAIERLINHDLMTSENTTTNHLDGITKKDLQEFWDKMDESLKEDRVEFTKMIEDIHKTIIASHPATKTA